MRLGEAKTCYDNSFEEPWWVSSNEYPQHMFLWRKKYNHQILILNNFSVCFIFKTGFDISWKLSPMKTICMKCQILFSGLSKTITTLTHAELAQKVINVKGSNITPPLKRKWFDVSCKASPLQTICMKCQILFSGENSTNITSLLLLN